MTLRKFFRTFLSGLIVVLPILVTVAVLMWLLNTAESMLGGVLRAFIPDRSYHPGLGLFAAFAVVFAIGLLMEAVYFRRVMAWLETAVDRIPLVKTIYSAVRDLMTLFSKSGTRRFGGVVLVRLPQLPAELIGFVTLEDFSSLPFAPRAGTVAVYLPMSYQIGGYTLFLPRECLTPVDMSLEEAMRFVVTAGMSRKA